MVTETSESNLTVFLFWSCLQLDLLFSPLSLIDFLPLWFVFFYSTIIFEYDSRVRFTYRLFS